MRKIMLSEYKPSKGILVDLEDSLTYSRGHVDGAINIPFNNLIYNFRNILNKNNKYYFYCKKGNKSRRIVSVLEMYNYDVTQVLIEE